MEDILAADFLIQGLWLSNGLPQQIRLLGLSQDCRDLLFDYRELAQECILLALHVLKLLKTGLSRVFDLPRLLVQSGEVAEGLDQEALILPQIFDLRAET